MANNYQRQTNKKGFTLVEMLVVIAIIAVLVAILVPTVLGAVTKARAATDAANLRSVLSVINISLLDNDMTTSEAVASAMSYECKTFKNAECYAVYADETMYIQIYYVVGDNAYGTDYFSEVIENGSSNNILSLSSLQTEFGNENVIQLKTGEE